MVQASPQVRDGRPAASSHTEQIELRQVQPRLVADLLENAMIGNAMIGIASRNVGENIDSPERHDRGRDSLIHRRRLRDINDDGNVAGCSTTELLDDLTRCWPIHVGHRTARAFGRHPDRARLPDAVSATGDEYRRPREPPTRQ